MSLSPEKNSAPSESEILAAVKKSGYFMDQEVASILELLDYSIRTSWPYEDPDTGVR
jgi:hypothetical protein